jgi:hypothetical protein
VVVLIDPPAWPAHGRLWSHLASPTSYHEPHAFAELAGVSRRAYEGDHYDVPQEHYDALVAAGASPVASRVLLAALQRSGLRLPKRRGERVLATWPDGGWLPAAGAHHVDLLASPFDPPPEATVGTRLLAVRGGAVAVGDHGLPPLRRDAGRPVGYLRARFDGPRLDDRTPWPRCYLALRAAEPAAVVRWVTVEALGTDPSTRQATSDAGGDVPADYWLPLARWLAVRA